MEEAKAIALHETLAKLKKSAGLGVASHYNFGKVKTKQVNGKTVRDDGLPNNPLYHPFVKEGTYDPSTADAAKYGDGRVIKRNFDDSKALINGDDSSSSDSSDDDKSKKKKKRKLEAKEKKKAEKKAAKLEAKRQAKLQEKRRAKIEAKKLAKKKAIAEAKEIGDKVASSRDSDNMANDGSSIDNEKEKRKKSKKDKKSTSGKKRKIDKSDVEEVTSPVNGKGAKRTDAESTATPPETKKSSKKKEKKAKKEKKKKQ